MPIPPNQHALPGDFRRRGFLKSLAAVGLSASLRPQDSRSAPATLDRPTGDPSVVAHDERYWSRVAAHYAPATSIGNLEGGHFGAMANPVLEEFRKIIERTNRGGTYWARTEYPKEIDRVRIRVATLLGVGRDEIALTRGATEAMQALIAGYGRLKSGDAVLFSDVDYPGMQSAMKWLEHRRGARIVKIDLPEPADRTRAVATYAAAFDANRGIRLVLLTHLNHKTGAVLPVAEIAALARSRGADILLDAAHALGQIDFSLNDLGVDFAGFNLHKWIGAPLGVGVLYIKRDRIGDIERMMGDEDEPPESITSRIHSGTVNFAIPLTVPAALDFHDAVGPQLKTARLRYLRDLWVKRARAIDGVDILTSDERGAVGAITSFRLFGKGSRDDNQRIVDELLTRHQVFTIRRTGLARGDCVRVTPTLANSPSDADRLVEGLADVAKRMR